MEGAISASPGGGEGRYFKIDSVLSPLLRGRGGKGKWLFSIPMMEKVM